MKKHKIRKMHGRLSKKTIALAVSIVLLLTLTVGGTLAYVVKQSATVRNLFQRSFVTSQVNENNCITNTGNVDAYIRAAVVVNFKTEDGSIYAIGPVEGPDYLLSPDENWTPSDGFYYYNGIVTPGTSTQTAPATVTNLSGKELWVEVVAEAIQAGGMGANSASAAWAAANAGN